MPYPLFNRANDNIFAGIVPTCDQAPLSTYELATLATLHPNERVVWDQDTLTLTYTLGVAKRGDLLCIPMHNLLPGSHDVLHITNNSGLDVYIPIPELQQDGFPPTLLVDLSLLEPDVDLRTASIWYIAIEANADDVVLGGALAIYGPTRTFLSLTVTDDFAVSFLETKRRNVIETQNEYQSPYVQDYGTYSRRIESVILVAATDESKIREWFDGNLGRLLPAPLWPNPPDDRGCFGRWQDTLEIETVRTGLRSIKLIFEEWPKGKAIAT